MAQAKDARPCILEGVEVNEKRRTAHGVFAVYGQATTDSPLVWSIQGVSIQKL